MRLIRTIKWNADVGVDWVGRPTSTYLGQDGFATKKQSTLQLADLEAYLQPPDFSQKTSPSVRSPDMLHVEVESMEKL